MALVLIVTAGAVLLSIGIHYEALTIISSALPRSHLPSRARLCGLVISAMITHLTEVLVFTAGLALLLELELGAIQGDVTGFSGLFYFSIVTYTSLGFGDVFAKGPIRVMAGVEALTGLLMIAWTASFTYLQMENFWRSGPTR